MSEFYLIKKDSWGCKIHIIWPSQIDITNDCVISDSITDKNLSQSHTHTGWCKTKVNGIIRKRPEEYNVDDICDSFCTKCLNEAIKSNSRNTPEYINNIIRESVNFN